jgi:hypothetical protein
MQGYETLTAGVEAAAPPSGEPDGLGPAPRVRHGDFAAGLRTRPHHSAAHGTFASTRRRSVATGRHGSTAFRPRTPTAAVGERVNAAADAGLWPRARPPIAWRVRRSGWRWPAGRGGARQRRLDLRQRSRERVDLRSGQIPDERRKALGQQRLSAGQRLATPRGQGVFLAAAVLLGGPPVKEPSVRQCGHQLRSGGAGHSGAACQLVDRYLLAGDRAQRQVLRRGQRRVVRGQQPLDPPCRQRRDRHQRLGGLGLGVTGSGHQLHGLNQ